MRNILVVEDEAEIRTMMQIALEEAGDFSVVSARGFDAAEATLKDEPPDLLILDAVVPRATGFPGRSAMEFAAYALARDVPIILMTGYAELADALEALHFPLLRKPFGIDELQRTAQAAMKRPKENSAPRARCARLSPAQPRRVRLAPGAIGAPERRGAAADRGDATAARQLAQPRRRCARGAGSLCSAGP